MDGLTYFCSVVSFLNYSVPVSFALMDKNKSWPKVQSSKIESLQLNSIMNILCESCFQVIPAIKSRCLGIRVPAPSNEDIVNVISNVAKKEGCSLPNELAQRIAEKSNRNLR